MSARFGSPVVRQRLLAAELRRLRELRGLKGDELAKRIGWSASKVSRYELGRTTPKPEDVQRLLQYYDVDPLRQAELLALAREAAGKGWWDAYADVLPEELSSLIGMETEARSSWVWHIEVIPGLLQTAAYAREVNRGYQRTAHVSPRQMERRVEARLERQQILRRDPPFELSVVLDESALRRRMAPNSVMREQLQRLTEVSKLPNVTLRVLPLQRLNPVITGSFVLLRFGAADDTLLPDVVYAERLNSNLFFEDDNETYLYQVAFERLTEIALEPQESIELISGTAEEVWT
jgi:transcriptional regulator with XRE-family HTH domain